MALTMQRFQRTAAKVINRYSGGYVAFASNPPQSTNPYEIEVSNPVLIGAFLSNQMRQLSAKHCYELFGGIDAQIYRVTFVNPNNIPIPEGCYALANFSDQTQVIQGVLQRLDSKLSGQVDAYINSSRQVPFDFNQLLGENLWLL